MLSDLRTAECWVFDLDNTLYPASSTLFPAIEIRMRHYIEALLGIDAEQADALRAALFRSHGTTMQGLIARYGIDPLGFLDYVHDVDLAPLDSAPALGGHLAALPGRKVIFTNGSVAHAERVLARLGLADAFEGIFDIIAAGHRPKPAIEPYRSMVEAFAITPTRTVMIEDMARNLAPAAALGMTTVWLRSTTDWACDGQGDHIHHVVDSLDGFLAGLAPGAADRAG